MWQIRTWMDASPEHNFFINQHRLLQKMCHKVTFVYFCGLLSVLPLLMQLVSVWFALSLEFVSILSIKLVGVGGGLSSWNKWLKIDRHLTLILYRTYTNAAAIQINIYVNFHIIEYKFEMMRHLISQSLNNESSIFPHRNCPLKWYYLYLSIFIKNNRKKAYQKLFVSLIIVSFC